MKRQKRKNFKEKKLSDNKAKKRKMEILSTLNLGLYASIIFIGGLFYEKNPILMGSIMVFGCILVAIKLASEVHLTNARIRISAI